MSGSSFALQRRLDGIASWCRVNFKKINESKSVVMIFGTPPTRLPPFTICGVPIEVVEKQVYIGFRLLSENVAFSLQGHYKVKAEKADAISRVIWGFEQKGGFHPKVAIFFASYLVQRFTCYAWKNFVSDRMQADVGVGQGSALSPVLCALVVAPIMKLYRIKEVGLGTTLITFVDDGTIAAQTDSIEMNCCMLYHAHAFIHALFTAASLVLEHDKYEAFHFTRARTGADRPIDLGFAPHMGATSLRPKKFWRYLGFYFDQRLTFVKHIRYYSTKALTTVMAMRMLGNSTRGLLPKNKHILYNVGALKTLSSMQRKAAIWITEVFRTSPTGGSELLAGLPPICLHLHFTNLLPKLPIPIPAHTLESRNAQKIAFQGNIVNAGNYVQIGPLTSALEFLMKYTAIGALHNSDERCDAPKCHAETRVAVQQEIISWIRHGARNVMWMTGPAGTGKTAIAGSVAESCKEMGLLAASFFFSSFARSRDRRSKRFLIATLVYQILQHDSMEDLGKRILAAIVKHPAIFQTRLKDQLEELVLEPLRESHRLGTETSLWPKVILIDGLDEVEPDEIEVEGAQSGLQADKDRIHSEILSVLTHAAKDPAFPFRVLIVSRPERVIEECFNQTRMQVITEKIFLDAKYDPDSDIALFLRSQFAQIRHRYNLPQTWPTEDAIQSLVRNASGQFIYAATVIRYVQDNKGLPQAQLDRVLELRTPTPGDGSNPFAALDALYRRILICSPNPQLAQKWLRLIRNISEVPALYWRLFLESAPGEGEYLLSALSSLVSIPSPHDRNSAYEFYHKSFWDFTLHRVLPSDPLSVPHDGPHSELGLRNARFVEVLKYKGPPPHVDDSDREAFLSHLTGGITSPLPVYSFHRRTKRNEVWLSHFQDDLLSCDVDWWIKRFISHCNCRPTLSREGVPGESWSLASDIISGFFWDVHALVGSAVESPVYCTKGGFYTSALGTVVGLRASYGEAPSSGPPPDTAEAARRKGPDNPGELEHDAKGSGDILPFEQAVCTGSRPSIKHLTFTPGPVTTHTSICNMPNLFESYDSSRPPYRRPQYLGSQYDWYCAELLLAVPSCGSGDIYRTTDAIRHICCQISFAGSVLFLAPLPLLARLGRPF
ncbi:hypothetical protein NMY22_g9862 [Coprinellus aureogranulatus]|nr:hypothetical protein NMY22_g9862 [Coprinellus aureogranulatus]